jgi:hypothetical protein
MRVMYRAESRSPRLPVVYRATGIKWCCEDMARQWASLIGFGVRDCPASTDREVNLYRDRPQANGKTVVETVEIAFCPFCGQPVEACRVK